MHTDSRRELIGHAEVGDLDCAICRQQHVAGFDVSVNHTLESMGKKDRVSN